MEGYINGINWVEVQPMKYWSFTAATPIEKRQDTVRQAIFSGDYIGALKVDGYYERLVKDEDGNCFMIARSRNVNGEVVNKIDWVPQLKEWMETIPNGTCLLAECYLPGNEGSKNITSILGCLKDKAIKRQEKTPLHFYIFDVMAFDGKNLDKTHYEDRIEYIDKMRRAYPDERYIHYAKFYEGETLWEKLQDYLASGREGIVIMRKDAIVYNKRTPARVSIKVKKELKETIDVVVLGANAPTREYKGKEIESWKYWENVVTKEKIEDELYESYLKGAPIEPVTKSYFHNWAGSLIIGARKGDKLIPIGSLSGLTEEVLSDWISYKGRVAEITAMQVFSETNSLRHAKFLKWREDLTARDTDYNRIFGEAT